MFQLLPIYNPKAVFDTWPQITEGMSEILEYTTGDSSFAKILNDLLSGNLLLWVGYKDNEYIGFVTTRIDDIPTCYRALSLVHVFVKHNSLKDIMLESITELDRFAKEQNCTKIRMWSIRDKAFNRVLEPIGFKQGYVEFIREVA